jgi:hypothetical protein
MNKYKRNFNLFICISQAMKSSIIYTSAALSKKNEATKRFFCPSPPPPFHTPPNVHFMCVHVDSLALRALEATLLHSSMFEPDGEAAALYSSPPYL